jgi:hypothetical protein
MEYSASASLTFLLIFGAMKSKKGNMYLTFLAFAMTWLPFSARWAARKDEATSFIPSSRFDIFAWGGGEIYFDDVLVRKDGLFVLDELRGLNPENLK